MTGELWARHPDVAWTDGEDRYVALNIGQPTTATPVILQGTAAWLWEALAEPSTLDQLVAAAAEASGADAATIRRDLESVLTDWHRQRLVSVSDIRP